MENALTLDMFLQSPLFIMLIPAVTSWITQFVKRQGIPPTLVLGILSLFMGAVHFLLTANTFSFVSVGQGFLLASVFIWSTATGYYKTLVKIFPSLSSENQ